jgi:hypothetical protein
MLRVFRKKEGQNERLIKGIKEYETRVVKGIEQQPDFKRQDKVKTTPVPSLSIKINKMEEHLKDSVKLSKIKFLLEEFELGGIGFELIKRIIVSTNLKKPKQTKYE